MWIQRMYLNQQLSKFYKFIVANGVVTCGYFKNFEYVFIKLYNVSTEKNEKIHLRYFINSTGEISK